MKQKDKQSSHALIVFSTVFLLYVALTPFISYLFGFPLSFVVNALLAIVFIVGAIDISSKRYLNNSKVASIFSIIGLLSVATIIFYYTGAQRTVEVNSVTKEVDAKVITEYGYASNFRVVLLSGENVIPVEDVKNWKDFHLGDAVYSIETVNETTNVKDVFGNESHYTTEYVMLKGKE